MVKSLYSKLAVTLLGVFCLLGVSVFIATQFASDMYQQEVVQKLNRDLARQIVAQKILMQDHRINEKGLKEIFDMLMGGDVAPRKNFIQTYAKKVENLDV